MTLLRRLSWISLALAAFWLVWFAIRQVIEGFPYLVFAVVFFAFPLVVIGLLLRSSRRPLQVVAGCLALILAVPYLASLVGSFTSAPDVPEPLSIWSALVNAVLCGAYVAFNLVVFWAAVLRHRPTGDTTVAPGHGVS